MFIRYLLKRRELDELSLRLSGILAECLPLRRYLLLSCIKHSRQALGPGVAIVPERLTSSYSVEKRLLPQHERRFRHAHRKKELSVSAERSAWLHQIEYFLWKQRFDGFYQPFIGFHDRWYRCALAFIGEPMKIGEPMTERP